MVIVGLENRLITQTERIFSSSFPSLSWQALTVYFAELFLFEIVKVVFDGDGVFQQRISAVNFLKS